MRRLWLFLLAFSAPMLVAQDPSTRSSAIDQARVTEVITFLVTFSPLARRFLTSSTISGGRVSADTYASIRTPILGETCFAEPSVL